MYGIANCKFCLVFCRCVQKFEISTEQQIFLLFLKRFQGRTVLHEAIISGRSLCFNLLLKQPNLDINSQDNQGWTPLFWAVNRGLEYLVQDLITADCDITAIDLSKNTALHEVLNFL